MTKLTPEHLRGAIGNVLVNATNYPEKVQPRILGQDMAPLIEKVAAAVESAARNALYSNTSVNGIRLTWEQLCEHLEAENRKLHAWARIVADLSRNQNGRHQGDADAGDPTGTSQGNPHLAVGQVFGYSISGARRAYARPARALEHDPNAWQVDATANTTD